MSNVVEQKVSLNTKEYNEALKKQRLTTKTEAAGINKEFESLKTGYRNTTNSIKKEGLSLGNAFKSVNENIKKGAAVIGVTGAVQGLTSTFSSSAKAVGDFDKTFAKLSSRFDFDERRIKKLRREYRALAGDVGISGAEINAAAENLLSESGGKSTGGLKDIAQFAKLSDDLNAGDVSRTAIDFLKGAGQDINQDNIKSFLESTLALSRKGDFSLSEALKLSAASDGDSLNRAGLSTRENAALLAGASKVGQDRGATSAAIQALVEKSVEGFGQGSALQNILGVDGGSLLTDGKFDVNKLAQASRNFNSRGLNSQDSVALLEGAGLSRDEAEGLFAILNDFDKFQEAFQGTVNDSKKLSEAFKESTNNLPDTLSKLREKIATGADEIVNPLSNITTQLLNGDIDGASSALPDALGDTASAMGNNKTLLAGLLAGSGAIGFGLSKTGLFGSAAGMAKGSLIEEVTGGDVQQVYVVNANEIGGSLDPSKLLAGGGKGIMGKLAGAGKILGKGAGVLGAGAAGYQLGSYLNDNVIDKGQYKSKDGFEGNFVEQAIHSMAKLFGAESAKNIEKANKLELVIDTRDEGFTAKPKRTDKSVDIKGL